MTADTEPAGGLTAYVNQVRADHHRLSGLTANGVGSWCSCGLEECAALWLLDHIDNLTPPAPRVFLPGDTVPKGVATVIPPSPDEDRAQPYVMHEAPWNYTVTRPVVELPLPSTEEVQAAVDRAHAALGGRALTTDAELHALTPDQLEKCIHRALKARDVQAVEGYLLLMALKDPGRAQYLMDTLKVGVNLAKEHRP